MILGVVNERVEQHFTVNTKQGDPIIGLDTTGTISSFVYDPSGNEVSNSINEEYVELGNGDYKYIFTPNVTGTWYINLRQDTYFPWGKTGDIQVYTGDISDIHDSVIKTLGLVHHNIYIDNTTYDEHGNMITGRVRIYSDAASVGTNNNVIETYLITADGTECGKFTYWEQLVL